MNGCYLFSSNHKKFYNYREVTSLLFEEEVIGEDTKTKLNDFKSTRIYVAHYVAHYITFSSFSRRKHQLTQKRIQDYLEMGIKLYEQIYQLGFNYFVDALADSMEEPPN